MDSCQSHQPSFCFIVRKPPFGDRPPSMEKQIEWSPIGRGSMAAILNTVTAGGGCVGVQPQVSFRGRAVNYRAMAIGARSQSAKTYLEKHFTAFEDCSVEDLVVHWPGRRTSICAQHPSPPVSWVGPRDPLPASFLPHQQARARKTLCGSTQHPWGIPPPSRPRGPAAA